MELDHCMFGHVRWRMVKAASASAAESRLN
ncbi:hypothetical protein COLO4_28985 [Corchorus olitorius]|uniref:Uncharacterized protein n=1 Tax=Corchorus olitorius TaxID=93759 RepID=A0A1R3HH50_9ROSI|nr:hypothetical protein COLO4_28985 [Corchorus olitorius]